MMKVNRVGYMTIETKDYIEVGYHLNCERIIPTYLCIRCSLLNIPRPIIRNPQHTTDSTINIHKFRRSPSFVSIAIAVK